MSETRVIFNADDFGMSRGITDGIILAHRYGVVTSASLMANMPAAEYAAAHSIQAPRLGVGIHLNVCQGRPILPASSIPSLVDACGNFHAPAALIRKLWRWGVAQNELEAEFRAQIRWMKERGLTPTHADSHHHMHIYPAAAIPFARSLALEGIRCARTSRCSNWPKDGSLGGPHEGSTLRRILVRAYRSMLQSTLFRNLASPDSRISFLSRDRHNLSCLRDRWKVAFENLPAGTFEFACHPGFFQPGFSEPDHIHEQREEELYCLTDKRFREILEQKEIHLITYNDLSCGPAMRRVATEAPAH